MDWNKIALVFVFLLVICGGGYGYDRHDCDVYTFEEVEHNMTKDGKLTLIIKNVPSEMIITSLKARKLKTDENGSWIGETDWLEGENTGMGVEHKPNETIVVSIKNSAFSDLDNYHIGVLLGYTRDGSRYTTPGKCVHYESRVNVFLWLYPQIPFLLIIYLSFLLFSYGFEVKKYKANIKKIGLLVPILFISYFLLMYFNIFLFSLYFVFSKIPILSFVFSLMPWLSIALSPYIVSYVIFWYLTGIKKPVLSFNPKVITLSVVWIVCMIIAYSMSV